MTIGRNIKEITEMKEFSLAPPPPGTKEKTIKYPLENLYAVFLGTKNETQEIAICRKEIDKFKNTYYVDLLTNSKYTLIPKENEIYAVKEHTLLSLMARSNLKDSIINNAYLTSQNLISLYNLLNEDSGYKCHNYKKPVEKYARPTYVKTTYNDGKKNVLDTTDKTWINTRIAIETSKKIIVISGEKGIGKTTLTSRIFHIDPMRYTSYLNDDEGCNYYTGPLKIDYNKLKKDTYLTKHLQNRIKKVMDYIFAHDDKRYQSAYIIIDNVDFSNPTFANLIQKEIEGTDIKVILISDRKIENDFLDKNKFNIVQATKPTPQTIKEIFSRYIGGTHRYSKDNENEINEILLNCDNPCCMNESHYENNPKLGVTIITNAISIAKAKQRTYITIDDLIDGMNLENINMSPIAKDKAEEEFQKLEQKIEEEQTKTIPKQKRKLFGRR